MTLSNPDNGEQGKWEYLSTWPGLPLKIVNDITDTYHT